MTMTPQLLLATLRSLLSDRRTASSTLLIRVATRHLWANFASMYNELAYAQVLEGATGIKVNGDFRRIKRQIEKKQQDGLYLDLDPAWLNPAGKNIVETMEKVVHSKARAWKPPINKEGVEDVIQMGMAGVGMGMSGGDLNIREKVYLAIGRHDSANILSGRVTPDGKGKSGVIGASVDFFTKILVSYAKKIRQNTEYVPEEGVTELRTRQEEESGDGARPIHSVYESVAEAISDKRKMLELKGGGLKMLFEDLGYRDPAGRKFFNLAEKTWSKPMPQVKRKDPTLGSDMMLVYLDGAKSGKDLKAKDILKALTPGRANEMDWSRAQKAGWLALFEALQKDSKTSMAVVRALVDMNHNGFRQASTKTARLAELRKKRFASISAEDRLAELRAQRKEGLTMLVMDEATKPPPSIFADEQFADEQDSGAPAVITQWPPSDCSDGV